MTLNRLTNRVDGFVFVAIMKSLISIVHIAATNRLGDVIAVYVIASSQMKQILRCGIAYLIRDLNGDVATQHIMETCIKWISHLS